MSGEDRKKQIVDVAAHVFAGENYDRATTAKIAEAAGVSEATIYLHFNSKKELFIEVLKECRTLAVGLVENTMEEYEDPFEGVKKVIERYHFFVTSQCPHVIKCMLIPIMVNDKEMRAELQLYDERIMSLIDEFLDKAKKEGRIKKEVPAKGLGRILAGLVLGMAINLSLEYDNMNLDDYLESVEMLTGSVRAESRA